MRLVDTDAERESFMEMVYEQLSDDPDNTRANLIIEYYDSLPPVEPVRGEWIKTFRYMRENVNTGNIEPVYSCDCPFCAWHTGNQGVRFNFCPNCGCDMRGEKND